MPHPLVITPRLFPNLGILGDNVQRTTQSRPVSTRTRRVSGENVTTGNEQTNVSTQNRRLQQRHANKRKMKPIPEKKQVEVSTQNKRPKQGSANTRKRKKQTTQRNLNNEQQIYKIKNPGNPTPQYRPLRRATPWEELEPVDEVTLDGKTFQKLCFAFVLVSGEPNALVVIKDIRKNADDNHFIEVAWLYTKEDIEKAGGSVVLPEYRFDFMLSTLQEVHKTDILVREASASVRPKIARGHFFVHTSQIQIVVKKGSSIDYPHMDEILNCLK